MSQSAMRLPRLSSSEAGAPSWSMHEKSIQIATSMPSGIGAFLPRSFSSAARISLYLRFSASSGWPADGGSHDGLSQRCETKTKMVLEASKDSRGRHRLALGCPVTGCTKPSSEPKRGSIPYSMRSARVRKRVGTRPLPAAASAAMIASNRWPAAELCFTTPPTELRAKRVLAHSGAPLLA